MPERDPQEPLRDDVRMLGEMLGQTLHHRGGAWLLETVERVRGLAKAGRQGHERDLDELSDLLRSMPVEHAVPVARAFAHFLTLANIAEQHQRVRRRRQHQQAHSSPQTGSFADLFPRLLSSGVSPETLRTSVAALRVDLVLTSHPTTIMRRTLADKQRRIAEALARQDRPDLTADERRDIDETLRREIAAMWETDEIREQRPTPVQEATSGLLVFEQALWNAVPQYLRMLDRALIEMTGEGLPLDAAPVTFGSWMGGDRDGNPTVTPDVTRRVCLVSRWMAADLYERELAALQLELSMVDASAELRARADGAREPYRAVLRDLRRRLRSTRSWLDGALSEDESSAAPADALLAAEDMREPLLLCYRSLVETGQSLIAGGRLTDALRRVRTFGLTLVRLDVRQHASKHAETIDAIARASGAGPYVDWSEAERQQYLCRALAEATEVRGGRTEVLRYIESAQSDVLDTLRALAGIHPESLGAYVVSMAQAPSDVLAVEYLQTLAGCRLRTVPLFEQVDDLARAPQTLRALLGIDAYRQRIGNRQEVMVGYSDSAKDGGRLAANWALYRAQEELTAVARDAGVELTLFHGRGGSISRGGGPTYLAIRSQPPGSIQGRLRVTEQGEMIQAQFGLPEIATRTLEVYTTATLEATLGRVESAPARWRDTMEQLAERARRVYREVVYEHPRFVEYFRAATPEVELGTVPIGSRPPRRQTADAGVDSLRAIPWVFAWTQTRLLLPSWLGAGDALDEWLGKDEAILREMYEDWPFFRSTMNLVETALAESDADIAAEYDRRLVPPDLRPLGEDLRRRLGVAINAILRITGHPHLLASNSVLRRSIDVRNPYVDPINLVQIDLLRRLRATDTPDRDVARAFMVTVNGIAAGMRNIG